MAKLSIIETEPAPIPFPSASRAALAAAIDLADKQKAQEANARIALKRGTTRVSELGTLVHTAHGAIASAMEADAARAAQAAASGTSFVTDKSLREARAAETEVRDELEAARTALAQLEASVDGAENNSRRAERHVAACAQAVVADEIPRVLCEALSVEERYINLRVILRALIRDLNVESAAIEQAKTFLLNGRDLPSTYGGFPEFRDWTSHHASGPWHDFYHALLKDPNAKAPSL